MPTIEQHWDYQRDLAKHSWPPAEVSSQADPDVPGLVGYVITGWCAQDVQHEINRLRDHATARAGEYHFTNPMKVGARYVATGHTQVGRAS